MKTNMSRRGFLTAAACFGTVGALGLAGCNAASQNENRDEVAYEEEADFVSAWNRRGGAVGCDYDIRRRFGYGDDS